MDDDGTVKSHRKITDSQGDFTCTLEDPCLVGTSVSAQGDLDSDGEGMVDLWESPNDMDPPARATRALPTPITYIYDGIGTGILGGSPFTNAVFTITALADTDNIAPWPPATGGPQNTHLSTLIDIAGLGSFSITTPSHSWMTGSGSGRGGLGANLSSNWVTLEEPALIDYGLDVAIGPVLEDSPQKVNQFHDVATTGGTLTFSSISTVSFTAVMSCVGAPDGTPCESDGDDCTDDVCMADVCDHPPITICADGDGCCPAGCTPADDDDCSCEAPPAPTDPDPPNGASGVPSDADLSWNNPPFGGPGTGSLTTTFASNNGQNGNMFDLTALETLTITGWDGNLDGSGGPVTIEVYYVTDHTTFVGKETNPALWTILGQVTLESANPEGTPTPVPIGGLAITSGETVGIYWTATSTGHVHYTNGPLGVFENDELRFEDRGTGNAYPFGTVFSPRVWNGTVYYEFGGGCPVTYDVLFGTDDPPTTLVCDDATETTCDPGPLAEDTTYFWQVVATNCCGSTDGPIWSFITGDECVGAEDGTPCDDGDECTENDNCSEGECSGENIDCDDGNDCTDDSCDPASGCVHTDEPDGTPCGDSTDDDCTDPDTCDGAGDCQDNHEPPDTACADDGNACTDDICDGGGTCTHPNNTDPCEDGLFCNGADTCSGGACSVHEGDPCADGTECNQTCSESKGTCFDSAGTACGDPTDDVCTDPDTCDGSGSCLPNDEPPSTECRADAGECDVPEFCDGAGNCPADGFEPSGTACGDPTDDVCTDPDTCDGSGGCLPNHEKPSTECRADAGECDVAEFCDGAGECPADGFEPDGTACGDPTDDDCTDPDTCDGEGACQNNHEPPDTPCADDGNECTDDVCDGDGMCTHPDELKGTACGDPTDDVCTDPDTCDGSGSCLSNHDKPSTECRADAGECDVAEFCDGEGNCPVDGFEPKGLACGDPTDDVCTDPDTCDGSGSCLSNHEKPSTECRADAGECDVAEFCDGAGDCPPDDFEPPDTPCGDPMDDDCTDPDTCNGEGFCQDNHEPPDAPCTGDGNDCTEDICDGSGTCTHPNEPDGTSCGEHAICEEGTCLEVLYLDIMPKSCPNGIRRGTNAAVWTALLGTDYFDITNVRMSTIELRRADGVGAALAPMNLKFQDEAAPFEGELCDCHAAGRDGITDLRMKFKTAAMVRAFGLDEEPSGVEILLRVTGTLNDGSPFAGSDCILVLR